jgi:vacuolar-type H+-ATPase subunit I/STV1
MLQAEKAQPKPDAVRRKIVYTATVDLVVEDFTGVPARVEAMVKQFDGYVADTTISGSPGSPRSGHWRIRVPVENYDRLVAAVQGLGEVRSVASKSQDVSEEYYDVQARIRNAKKEEERLLKLLDTATGKLEEVLKVESELARVRGEIERVEGRLRVLDSLTAMSTLELRIEEIKDYVPEEAPTYLTRLRRAFSGSITLLVSTAQTLSIVLVALSPWLIAILVPLLLVWLVVWAVLRRKQRG